MELCRSARFGIADYVPGYENILEHLPSWSQRLHCQSYHRNGLHAIHQTRTYIVYIGHQPCTNCCACLFRQLLPGVPE
jgi:hypothetical protein